MGALYHGATGDLLLSGVGAVLMRVLPSSPHLFHLPLGCTLIDLLLPSHFLAPSPVAPPCKKLINIELTEY